MKDIQKLQQEIYQLQSQIDQKRREISKLQRQQINEVKSKVIKKYLKILDKIELYKIDSEIIDAIFTIANIQNGRQSQIEIRYLLDGRIDIKYFNVREQEWRTL
jgi:dsDNA-specific endonuclease/ATPase MutS2